MVSLVSDTIDPCGETKNTEKCFVLTATATEWDLDACHLHRLSDHRKRELSSTVLHQVHPQVSLKHEHGSIQLPKWEAAVHAQKYLET